MFVPVVLLSPSAGIYLLTTMLLRVETERSRKFRRLLDGLNSEVTSSSKTELITIS